MDANNFSEHWAQAQFCYFRAETARNPVIKHLWIQLAQDWIALSDDAAPGWDHEEHERGDRRQKPHLVA